LPKPLKITLSLPQWETKGRVSQNAGRSQQIGSPNLGNRSLSFVGLVEAALLDDGVEAVCARAEAGAGSFKTRLPPRIS
jgi:hypothetical protein